MKIVKFVIVGAAGAAVGALINHNKEVRKTQVLVRKTREDARDETWSYAFQSGWEGAKTHYTRYFDEKTWMHAFGEPRPW